MNVLIIQKKIELYAILIPFLAIEENQHHKKNVFVYFDIFHLKDIQDATSYYLLMILILILDVCEHQVL